MRIVRDCWVEEVQDVMVTIELALLFNSDKDIAVRRCANKMKNKYSPEINKILKSWRESSTPYADYDSFMTRAGL